MRLVKGLLERSLHTIELLAAGGHWQRLSDIATALDLQKGPAHRLLKEMTTLGWVEQDSETERYRLTLKLALLGQQYLRDTRLSSIVQPVLDGVAKRCGELVRLTVVQGDALHWFASAQGAPPGLMYQPALNGRPVLHATANGKVWLSTMSNEAAIRLALESGLGESLHSFKIVGPKAIQTIDELLRELESTRSNGYGLAVEEGEPGIKAIATAVRESESQKVLGTISIAGPLLRMTQDRDSEFYELLLQASSTLGLVWPLESAGVQQEN